MTATTRALPAGSLRFLMRYVTRHRWSHALVFGSVVAAVACAVGSQYAVKHLVDVLSAGRHDAVWTAFGILAGLIAADNMMWRVGGWAATHCFVDVSGDVRRDLFQHLTEHAPAFFADRPPGTLAGRITATGNAIFQVENTFAWNVLPPCLAVVGSVVVLLGVNLVMALVLVALSAGLSFAMVRLAEYGAPLHHTYARDAAAVDGELVDVINNMPLVRAFGATMRERERFSSQVARETDARGRSLRFLEKLRLFHAATTAVMTAGLLAWAIVLWERAAATAGDVVLVSTLGFTILHGTRDLAVALVDTVQNVARLSEALDTLLQPPEGQDAPDARSLEKPREAPVGGIVFAGVSFSYPGGQEVLHGLDLAIAPGTRIGLVGRSGSGKTTVLALLQRLRVVTGGRILIDGQDIATLTEASLRDAIGVVPQDVSLFHRSVLENIRYGRPEATDEAVRGAAEAAGCIGFVDALPAGFSAEVGDRGAKLSGGQRQRLAIARAFLRDAPILLLDEATSALDTESELQVQEALERLMVGRTVVAVAHRLSTLRTFDRIVVLDAGRVVQDGAPTELEQVEGPFQALLRMQAASPRAVASIG